MKREIILTADGSTSIRLPDWDENYHSRNGAIAEAYHVFIRNGLDLFGDRPVSILEIGFGTGLNAFITLLESRRKRQSIRYTAIEAYPVSAEEASRMNFPDQLGADRRWWDEIHSSEWETGNRISDEFFLRKQKTFFQDVSFKGGFDLIYFDAFGFRVQPELWSVEMFQKMYDALEPSGILVTYAARSIIRKNMEAAGFRVGKLAGPPGKREMVRAQKI